MLEYAGCNAASCTSKIRGTCFRVTVHVHSTLKCVGNSSSGMHSQHREQDVGDLAVCRD